MGCDGHHPQNPQAVQGVLATAQVCPQNSLSSDQLDIRAAAFVSVSKSLPTCDRLLGMQV